MSDRRKRMVQWLGGILRVADNLDRGHRNLIKDLKVDWTEDKLTIKLEATDDVSMERDHAMENRHLLEMACGMRVEIE